MTDRPNMIELREVTHAYKTKAGPLPVLDNLTIAIPENTFCAVVGEGAGAALGVATGAGRIRRCTKCTVIKITASAARLNSHGSVGS